MSDLHKLGKIVDKYNLYTKQVNVLNYEHRFIEINISIHTRETLGERDLKFDNLIFDTEFKNDLTEILKKYAQRKLDLCKPQKQLFDKFLEQNKELLEI